MLVKFPKADRQLCCEQVGGLWASCQQHWLASQLLHWGSQIWRFHWTTHCILRRVLYHYSEIGGLNWKDRELRAHGALGVWCADPLSSSILWCLCLCIWVFGELKGFQFLQSAPARYQCFGSTALLNLLSSSYPLFIFQRIRALFHLPLPHISF